MKKLALCLVLALTGCIRAPAAGGLGVAPGTPAPSPQQVSSCETTRTWHNIWTISASLFGAAAGAQGGADAISTNHDVQVGIGIGVAASGLLAAVSATAAGMEADTYSTNNCQTVLSQAANVSSAGPSVKNPGF